MRRRLFKVEDCLYTVSGSLVLAAKTRQDSLDFKEGDSIVLIKPDGTEIETQIGGTGRFKVINSYVESITLDGLKNEDVPIGTEVYLEKVG